MKSPYDHCNLIVVAIDSLRQDHVSYYNKGSRVFENVEACKTPNLDRFARESIVFNNAYPSGLPTLPARTELLTGQFTLPYKPWGPLNPSDVTLPEILKRERYVTGLVTDLYHFFEPGRNFHKGFDSFEWIRGNEWDAYNSAPPVRKKVENYINEHYTKHYSVDNTTGGPSRQWTQLIEAFLANTDDFVEEEDWFAAKVFDYGAEWARKNKVHDRIFLWVDNFDPHEPWDPLPKYDTYTSKSYSGPRLIMPMGGQAKDWATPEEIDYIRGLYAGETSFVDHRFGIFYNKLKESGLLDNSIMVVLADHGHPLADHGKFLKGPDRMYNEVLKVPFMIRLPGGERHRDTNAIVQFPDFLPTMLDVVGLGNNASAVPGKSFSQVIMDGSNEHRKYSITGMYDGVERCYRDSEWSYVLRPKGEAPELYNLVDDRKERRNLASEKPQEVKRLSESFGSHFLNHTSRILTVMGGYELSGTAHV